MADGPFNANSEIAIHVDDLDGARRFYGEVLGFSLEDESEDGLAFLAGPHLLYVIPNEEPLPPILSMNTQDLAKARSVLEEAGAEIIKEGEGGLYFEDPFGIVWDVVVRDSEAE